LESRRKKTKTRKRVLKWIAFSVIIISLATFLYILATPLPRAEVPVVTRVLGTNGEEIARLFVQNRIEIPGDQIPDSLRAAVVAVEDERFYWHKGIDPVALARALFVNLRAGRVVEGGSTITQQLAKNLFLWPERTLTRKIHEAFLTIKLELQFSKQEILTMYLNQIYLGHGAYGVEVASRTYFGKPASDLTVSESALIAGVLKSPENYSPYRNMERAIQRRDLVLTKMLNQGKIDQATYDSAREEEVKLAGLPRTLNHAPYFVDFLIRHITAWHKNITEADLIRGGFTIRTTIDLKMQQAAAEALVRGLGEGKKDEKGVEQPQGAIVAIDPTNGHIKAMVGGKDFENTQFNRAVMAKRQPGSAFKPFLYAAVLEAGFTAVSREKCEPVSFPTGVPGQMYEPKDYGDQDYHFREMTLREAIRISDNVVAVRWANRIKPSKIISVAQRMGIESLLEPNLSLALGSSVVTPLELAVAYAPLANGGLRVEPIFLLSLEDRNGNVLETQKPRLERALDEKVAYLLTDILKEVVRPGGTAGGVQAVVKRPAAGKTGTTDEFRDAWFVGFTPDIVAAVYVGNDDERFPVGRTGGAIASPIWADFIKNALADLPARDFPRPAGIVEINVCSETGLLPNSTCPTVKELFIKGTEPKRVDPTVHVREEQPAPWRIRRPRAELVPGEEEEPLELPEDTEEAEPEPEEALPIEPPS